jgi:hypothetical protein
MTELFAFLSYMCPMHTHLVICVAQYSKISPLLHPQMEYLCTRQKAEYAQETLNVVKGWDEGNKRKIYHYIYILVTLTRFKK